MITGGRKVSKRRRNSGSVDAGARTFEDDFGTGLDDNPIDPVAAVFATPRKPAGPDDDDVAAEAEKSTRTRLYGCAVTMRCDCAL